MRLLRMRALAVVTVLLLGATMGPAIAIPSRSVPSENLVPKPTRVEGRLRNGVGYLIEHSPKSKKVSAFLIVRAGYLNERRGEEEFSHLIEHMAFSGTRALPGRSLNAELEKRGLPSRGISASTNFDSTIYELNFEPGQLDERFAVHILRQIAFDIDITPEGFASERKLVWAEGGDGSSGEVGRDRSIYDQMFRPKSLPPRRHNLSDQSTIEQVRAFYHNWYVPERMNILVVGNVEENLWTSEIRKQFEGVSVRRAPTFIEPARPRDLRTNSAASIVESPGPDFEVRVSKAWMGPSKGYRTPVDELRGDVLSDLISKLLQIRTQAYQSAGVQVSLRPFIEAAQAPRDAIKGFEGRIGTKRLEDLRPAVDKLSNAMLQLARYGFKEYEVRRAKNALRGEYLRLASNEESMRAGEYAIDIGQSRPANFASFQSRVAVLDSLSTSEINTQLKSVFLPSGGYKLAIMAPRPHMDPTRHLKLSLNFSSPVEYPPSSPIVPERLVVLPTLKGSQNVAIEDIGGFFATQSISGVPIVIIPPTEEQSDISVTVVTAAPSFPSEARALIAGRGEVEALPNGGDPDGVRAYYHDKGVKSSVQFGPSSSIMTWSAPEEYKEAAFEVARISLLQRGTKFAENAQWRIEAQADGPATRYARQRWIAASPQPPPEFLSGLFENRAALLIVISGMPGSNSSLALVNSYLGELPFDKTPRKISPLSYSFSPEILDLRQSKGENGSNGVTVTQIYAARLPLNERDIEAIRVLEILSEITAKRIMRWDGGAYYRSSTFGIDEISEANGYRNVTFANMFKSDLSSSENLESKGKLLVDYLSRGDFSDEEFLSSLAIRKSNRSRDTANPQAIRQEVIKRYLNARPPCGESCSTEITKEDVSRMAKQFFSASSRSIIRDR